MSEQHSSTFEVFSRRNWESRLEHCGTIHAPDADAALLLARETHFRHEEGVEFAVVPTDAFTWSPTRRSWTTRST